MAEGQVTGVLSTFDPRLWLRLRRTVLHGAERVEPLQLREEMERRARVHRVDADHRRRVLLRGEHLEETVVNPRLMIHQARVVWLCWCGSSRGALDGCQARGTSAWATRSIPKFSPGGLAGRKPPRDRKHAGGYSFHTLQSVVFDARVCGCCAVEDIHGPSPVLVVAKSLKACLRIQSPRSSRRKETHTSF